MRNPKAFSTAQVDLNAATATSLAIENRGRESVTIINTSTVEIYIGTSAAVTAATGAYLAGIKGASLTIATTAPVYAIAASATPSVAVVEVMQ